MKTLFQYIRQSYTTQLTIWVAGFVTAIFGIAIFLMARFSRQVVIEETLDSAMQSVENTVLKIENTEHLVEMSARLEKREAKVDTAFIDQLLTDQNGYIGIGHSLPNAKTIVLDMDDRQAMDSLGTTVPRGRSGYHKYMLGGRDYYIFYKPLQKDRWSVVITCPVDDIFHRFGYIQMLLLVIGISSLLVIIYIIWKVFTYHLRPLHLLADSAMRISEGHLEEQVPDSGQKDEIGQLQNSFATMQRSLANYMDEMRQKQDMLSRQNEALQEAYRQVRENENVKTMFLSKMTDQMVKPVDDVCQLTHQICKDYRTLSKVELTKIQIDMLSHTESITQLLDQLLNTPVQNNKPSAAI